MNLPVLVVQVCIHRVATAVRERFLHRNKQIVKNYIKTKTKQEREIKKDNDPVGYFASSLTVQNPGKM